MLLSLLAEGTVRTGEVADSARAELNQAFSKCQEHCRLQQRNDRIEGLL